MLQYNIEKDHKILTKICCSYYFLKQKISQRWNSYSGMFKWVKGKKNIFTNAINRNKYFVEIMNKYFYFDSEFMLKYKKETKDIIKNFYLNGDIVCSYEDITYK